MPDMTPPDDATTDPTTPGPAPATSAGDPTRQDVSAAFAALEDAQRLLEASRSDIERLDEILPWLQEAIARVTTLNEIYAGAVQAHLAAIHAVDAGAVTPPVANEDSVWELSVDLDDRLLRLLRIVAAEITSRLDD